MITPLYDAAVREHRAHLVAARDRLREHPTPMAKTVTAQLLDDILELESLDDEDKVLADAYLGLMS